MFACRVLLIGVSTPVGSSWHQSLSRVCLGAEYGHGEASTDIYLDDSLTNTVGLSSPRKMMSTYVNI
jgi:hypothetical protein